MGTRRGFLLTVVTGVVAMALVVGSVIADELLGVISKVDTEGKKITVIENDTEKEIVIKITDDTEQVVRKKGEAEPSTAKLDMEKLETKFKKYEDQGKKISVKVTHDKKVASKIEFQRKKKAAQ